MLLLYAGLTAVGAVTAKSQCVDAARVGALSAARGEPGAEAAAAVAPPGAAIDVAAGAETVTVCELRDLDLVVRVEVDVPGLPGPARAAARAGPVSTPV